MEWICLSFPFQVCTLSKNVCILSLILSLTRIGGDGIQLNHRDRPQEADSTVENADDDGGVRRQKITRESLREMSNISEEETWQDVTLDQVGNLNGP